MMKATRSGSEEMVKMHITHMSHSLMVWMIMTATAAFSADPTRSFTFGQEEFLLDGKPFQVISEEIPPTASHSTG